RPLSSTRSSTSTRLDACERPFAKSERIGLSIVTQPRRDGNPLCTPTGVFFTLWLISCTGTAHYVHSVHAHYTGKRPQQLRRLRWARLRTWAVDRRTRRRAAWLWRAARAGARARARCRTSCPGPPGWRGAGADDAP